MYVTERERRRRARRRQRPRRSGATGVRARAAWSATRQAVVKPRRRRSAGDSLFMVDRPRAPHRARTNTVGAAAVGNANGRLASQNYNATGAPLVGRTTWSSPALPVVTKACAASSRAYDQTTGQGSVALLDGAGARRTRRPKRGRGTPSIIPRCGHVDDRQLRRRTRHAVLDHRQPGARHDRRRSSGRQPLYRLGRGAGPARPAS